jgi:crotonobetainyl-CoA:carnitine CoA-transferase CaiB-like acyl-CoA transferase
MVSRYRPSPKGKGDLSALAGRPDTPPTSPPFGFAGSIAGISAAMGTAMALYRRER